MDDLFGHEESSKALHSLVGDEEEEEEDSFDASDDSGISSDRINASEGGYVCEYSDLEKLEEVKKCFHEPDPLALEGLLVIGKKCSARTRAKERHEETRILESLAAQGLLQSDTVKA